MPRAWAERVAFSSSLGAIDFGRLREAMLGFAGWLPVEAGVRRGDRVAVCLPKSLEAVQAIYGILAVGAAYVGLQHGGPLARASAILGAAAPRLLLTTTEMRRRLEESGPLPPTLCFDAEADGGGLHRLLAAARPLAAAARVDADDLAAIVFTSGSTGEPKGVMLSHRNIGRDVAWMVGADEMGSRDLRLSQVPLHYISPHLFQPPLAGSRVHLLTDEENMFPDRVAEAMEREQVTVWAAASTALRLLLESGALAARRLPRLRLVKSHGEVLPMPVLRAAMSALPQARFTTTYGATEAPDIALYEVPRPLPADLETLPLGAAQPGYEVRICDEAGRGVPAGETGEICCIGEGVCLGYWRDDALTEARRLPGLPNSFRSGDLGFLDERGLLHFAGRKAQLVKLRGHRFDLGEIEAALRLHPAVRSAVAFAPASDGSEESLVASVEADPDPELPPALMRICAERLPRFAWPTSIRVLGRFPRLPNGKIDRQRLRGPVETN